MIDKKEIEFEVQRILALNYVKGYCEANNLSFLKVSNQSFLCEEDVCKFGLFAKDTSIIQEKQSSNNFLDTLTIAFKNDTIIVKQSQYTNKYLSLD